jgi:beta-glucosidase
MSKDKKLVNEGIIAQMSLQEKALMMSGKSVWETVDFEKYGIPSMFLSDGPHGLRKQAGAGDHLGLNASIPATCYPTAATMANSWDEELGEELGAHLSAEARAIGVDVILGPGLNMKRNPLCGRNFEYFSEDPYLAGKMAAAYIRGMQQNDVSACPKHFAANFQETRRMSMDSVIDERTLREIYLTGFEIAVKEGHPHTIMTSYNKVNGQYANENAHLLDDILYGEWDYDGIVVSDWGGSNDHVEGVRHGSHLEMPSTGKMGAKEIVKAVQEGRLEESLLDKRVDELLCAVFHNTKGRTSDGSFDKEAHHAFARKAAAESVVLLQNKDNILPLAPGTGVALIGEFAKVPRYQGAGSSLVNPTFCDDAVSLIESTGLKFEGYARGYIRNEKPDAKLIQEAVELAKNVQVVLLYVGLDEVSESEGLDREHMHMPQGQLELIEAVCAANKDTVVVLQAGSSIEMPWADRAAAILHGYLGGQAGAGALLDIITGKVCPSGKLAETYPYQYADTPSAPYYPAKEKGSECREGLYIGYRYFDTVGKAVRYPFGYGLSYTGFSYDNLRITEQGVTFDLTNTGNFDGAEVAQLYVGKSDRKIFAPKKQLKGFQKVFLKKNETKTVTIAFDDKTFRYYNTAASSWETEGGQYEIYVAANVSDVRLSGSIDVAASSGAFVDPYAGKSLPSYETGMVTAVSDKEYEQLYGKPLPNLNWDKSKGLDVNDALCQMYYARSFIARAVWKKMTSIKEKSEREGKPNLNILFIYNMPFRGISKMTGGKVSMRMVRFLLGCVNRWHK